MELAELDGAGEELPELTVEDRAVADAVEREQRRRQRQAGWERHWWRGLALLGLGGLLVVSILDHLDRRETVVPFVVALRETAEGQVTLVEPVQRLRDYVVPGEAIQHMLGQFIKDLRKRGLDPIEREDSQMNVQAAVCGPAAQQILRPPVREAELVSVTLTKFRPSLSPKTHTVAWLEQWSDANGTYLGRHAFEADITVERREIDWTQPEAFAIWLRAPMGLCVSSLVINEVFATP